jgi:hypothetical protein
VAEREGEFGEALVRFGEMSMRVQALAALEPTVPRWQTKVTESTIALANIQAVTGRLTEAADGYARALASS